MNNIKIIDFRNCAFMFIVIYFLLIIMKGAKNLCKCKQRFSLKIKKVSLCPMIMKHRL